MWRWGSQPSTDSKYSRTWLVDFLDSRIESNIFCLFIVHTITGIFVTRDKENQQYAFFFLSDSNFYQTHMQSNRKVWVNGTGVFANNLVNGIIICLINKYPPLNVRQHTATAGMLCLSITAAELNRCWSCMLLALLFLEQALLTHLCTLVSWYLNHLWPQTYCLASQMTLFSL